MSRLAAVAVAFAVLAACGGEDPEPGPPIVIPTTPAPATTKPRPTTKPTQRPTPTTPAPTTSPPPSGTIVTTTGAFLALAPAEPPRRVTGGADCGTVFPEVQQPRCDAIAMAGGSLLWVTGRVEGSPVVRLLTQDSSGGYVTRYASRDDAGAWGPVKVFAAPLTGRGLDGVVVAVRLNGGALTYDVVTWFKGGPLVLRAHRGPLTDGRVVARNGNLEDYALVPDGRYARRVIGWDGRYFRASRPSAVPPEALPPR